MRSLAYSEDPDEMPHNPAFHHSQHCLLWQNDLQGKKYVLCGNYSQ